MREIPIVLSSGLPRSGSTLLQNLLAQSRKNHCTSTNDLLDMLVRVRDSWMASTGFIAQGLKKVEPRVKSFLREAIYGFYHEEFDAGKTVIDKSRGWLSHIELIEQLLQRPVKVIVPVRDVRDVLASFEKIYRKSTFTDHPVTGPESFQRLTVQGRAERLLSIEKMVGYVINCLRDVYARGLADRLVIVPYRELTHEPIATIERVCVECGLEPFTCDSFRVEQVTLEDDTVYGMDLHATRPVVEPDQGEAWRGVIDEPFMDFVASNLTDIQALARRSYVTKERLL